MSEIDVVVDVRQHPDTAELIVVKQKMSMPAEARPIGPPVELRLGPPAPNTPLLPMLLGANSGQIEVHRRARPAFDTLPEKERLAVLKAVAPLCDLEREQWASAQAQPLEGVPHTFAMRALDDLVVLLTQTQNKGVEIMDIVRAEALEPFRVPDPTKEGAR